MLLLLLRSVEVDDDVALLLSCTVLTSMCTQVTAVCGMTKGHYHVISGGLCPYTLPYYVVSATLYPGYRCGAHDSYIMLRHIPRSVS